MRFNIGILLIVFVTCLFSCNKGPQFKDFKKAEREAIANLIAKEGFEIIDRYPANGVFGEKQFYKLDNECYLNVVDSGNGNRADSLKTRILMRCSLVGITKTDTFTYSIFPNGFSPVEFVYGRILEAKIITKNQTGSDGWYFLSPGVETALQYVGENAIVRMIIPFDNGQGTKYPYGIGSVYQDEYRVALYLDRVRFVFDND
ncbi:MAG: DUF4827 domain-containing protein [Tannerella sp.]|jgi:hypothetical protein|nr:DUF4827 domain-containing protein [Tannerella sp.]